MPKKKFRFRVEKNQFVRQYKIWDAHGSKQSTGCHISEDISPQYDSYR